MTSPQHLLFLERITGRLAAVFQEVHQLCVSEIERIKQPQQVEQEQLEVAVIAEEAPPAQVAEAEVEAPEQVDKEAKTKRIRKQGDDRSGEDKGRKKGKPVSHKPKAPASSFLLFFKQNQASISRTYPTYGVTELTKVAAKCWKQLSEEEKQPFIKQCDDQRKLYQQKMQKYRIDFPQEVAEKEKARKPAAKKERKTSANVNTPKKEKEDVVEDNNVAQPNGSIIIPEQESDSDNEEEMDSLGVV